MKKKILLLIAVLVTAVLLVSGCSTDSLKERVPGVKANVNMLLADNDEGDLEYQLGEIENSLEPESSSSEFGEFGTDLIVEIENEISGLEITNTGISTGLEGETNTSGETQTKTFESENIEIDFNEKLENNDDLSDMIENIVFDDDLNKAGAKLEISVNDPKIEITSLEVNIGDELYNSTSGEINLSNKALDFNKKIICTINAGVTVEAGETFPNNIDLIAAINPVNDNNDGNVSISSIDTEITEAFFNDLVNNGDYKPSINEILIENYENEDLIDKLIVSESEMYIDFNIAEGINLDLSKVFVKSVPESGNKFALADSYLSSGNNRANLDLNRIVAMLQDSETSSDVLIDGEIGLSSDGIITITRESELGVKNAVLESAELTIDNYQLEPEAAEEGLTASEVDDIKKSLESIELTVEGLTNPLPAAVDLKLYVKDGAANKEELYLAENLLKTFNLEANTDGISETVILKNDKFDKFIGNNIYLGVELYSDTTFIPEEYSEKIIEAAQVKAKFNIDLNVDDIDE